MTSPILEALPSVHVTILGVIAAFFSAFVIYAYQKVNDAKERLEAALKHSMNVTTPTSMMFNGVNKYLNSDGTLNWDKTGRDTLWRASHSYTHLDYEDKYGVHRRTNQKEPEDQEIIDICNDLFLLFTTVFTSYPFWGSQLVYIEGTTDKTSKLSEQEFDSARLKEMQKIIEHLCWTLNISSHSLMNLAKKGSELTEIKERKEWEERFKDLPMGTSSFDSKHVTDFQEIFSSFFEKTHLVNKEIIPLLTESVSNFTTYNKTFKIRETTLKVIAIIVVNLILGVMLPLIVLTGINIERPHFWFSVFEYYVLLITMAPYIWVCWHLHKKVKTLNFA